ncbi:hypothetical protein CPB83DRAFT_851893 [Crepidotus variabilis]|uniref:Uncharacterized protein n=1 Tax=Crepidotus variabilis TaxID=179855 RepID=A0A9P6JRN9_9AGAR|nr:hypothetical protein CPB83DRAFT_862779 [Crepidotus variabilis]KAF9529954.1 hypothetical protein CPB83DRAFT_851893 [Crepidotus variabilis]
MYDEGQEDEEYDWEWIQQILREQNRRVSLEDEEYEDDMLACAGIIAYGLRKWGAVCKKGKRGLKSGLKTSISSTRLFIVLQLSVSSKIFRVGMEYFKCTRSTQH